MVKALVLTGFGINCEEEMAAAYTLAGAEATIVHLNDVFLGKVDIHNFDILNFPGGFSFGDDLGSGKVMANKIKYKKLPSGVVFLDEIKRFIGSGKFVMGICNGFQMLVRMGLLPNVGGDFQQEATLGHNNSGKYEDRWVYCKVADANKTPFLKGLDVFPVPVRHGEGKLIVTDPQLEHAIQQQTLNCLTYCDADGNPAVAYPQNPNGSWSNCAGLSDPSGQVFGLMPHPEAFLSLYNHPNWGQLKRQDANISEEGAGLQLFKNIVNHVQSSKLELINEK